MFDKLKKINENQPIKKFNYPIIIVPVLFIVLTILTFIGLGIIDKPTIATSIFVIISVTLFVIFLFLSISCPICLYFQIKNKQKTILDKILLTANVIYSAWITIYMIPAIFIIFLLSWLIDD